MHIAHDTMHAIEKVKQDFFFFLINFTANRRRLRVNPERKKKSRKKIMKVKRWSRIVKIIINGIFSGVIRLHVRFEPAEIELPRTCFSVDIQLPPRDHDICPIL